MHLHRHNDQTATAATTPSLCSATSAASTAWVLSPFTDRYPDAVVGAGAEVVRTEDSEGGEYDGGEGVVGEYRYSGSEQVKVQVQPRAGWLDERGEQRPYVGL
jgi:hypothetical protein